MKKREITAGLALLSFVSGLCLAGLKAIDRKLAKQNGENGDHKKITK